MQELWTFLKTYVIFLPYLDLNYNSEYKNYEP